MLPLVFLISVLGLIVAFFFARSVLKSDQGTASMQEIALAIKQGAMAFLKRQYTTIGWIAGIGGLLLFGVYWFTDSLNVGWA